MSVSFTTLIENYAKYRNNKKYKTNVPVNLSTDITDAISNSNSDKKTKNEQKKNVNTKELFKTNTMQPNKDTIQYQNTKYDLTLVERPRNDSRGVPIIKGSKNHKVSFQDKIGKHNSRLVEIIEIESYKLQNGTFNFNDPHKKQNQSSISCCIVF